METISNITAAASKAIWGDAEANKEPISGAQGDVSKGQPYDAGNLDVLEQDKVQGKADGPSHDYEPGADSNYTTAKTTNTTTESSLADSKPRAMDDHTPAPAPSSAAIDAPSSSTSASSSTPADTSAAKPAPGDTTAQQNDTRDPDDDSPQVDIKGPGPRPLNVVAKEHGGDAGRDHDVDSKDSSASSSTPAPDAKDVSGDSDSKGSGNMYVKTSGLAADGGDFDATKPGAGREADRIMEEKGIHHEEGKKDSTSSSGSSKGHSKDKPSLSERIKAKLHKH